MEEFQSELANPEIKKFRTKVISPELEEKLDGLFSGSVAKGDHVWAPSAGPPPTSFFGSSLCHSNTPTSVEEFSTESAIPDSGGNTNDDLEEMNFASERAVDLTRKQANISSAHKQKQPLKKSKGGASSLSSKIDDIKEGIENHKNAIMERMNKMPPTISDVVKVLMSMEKDIPPCSQLYRFATKLLLNKEKREMFIALETYSTRLWYLKEESNEAEANEARKFSSLVGSQQYTFSS